MPADSANAPDPATQFRVAELPQNGAATFDLRPDPAECKGLAKSLDLLALRKPRFAGRITASGRRDFLLRATLGATVVQPCSVTLSPVTTRVEAEITRTYVARMPHVEAPETEMHDDESIEELPETIDIRAVMAEALALHLPLYPRADGAELGEAVFAAPGTAPMRDEDARPFAGLAALRGKADET